MAVYFATTNEIDESIVLIKKFLHVLQEENVGILNDGKVFANFNNLWEGLERIFKVVIVKTLELQETAQSVRELFNDNYKTHNLNILWGFVSKICLASKLKTGGNIVLEDIQDLVDDEIFNHLLEFCSYIGNASDEGGRYVNINTMLGGRDDLPRTRDKADELYEIIMKWHDPNYRQYESAEIQKTYQANSNQIKRGENPQHQPPQPYQEKMRGWFRDSIIERIEKLLRSLAIYLHWGIEGGHLCPGTSIDGFNKMTLGKTSY
jgi:hypothetical protein